MTLELSHRLPLAQYHFNIHLIVDYNEYIIFNKQEVIIGLSKRQRERSINTKGQRKTPYLHI